MVPLNGIAPYSKCLEANGELQLAIEEIGKAIASTSSPKYENSLAKRKAEMEARL